MFRFTRKPSSGSHSQYLIKIIHSVKCEYMEVCTTSMYSQRKCSTCPPDYWPGNKNACPLTNSDYTDGGRQNHLATNCFIPNSKVLFTLSPWLVWLARKISLELFPLKFHDLKIQQNLPPSHPPPQAPRARTFKQLYQTRVKNAYSNKVRILPKRTLAV